MARGDQSAVKQASDVFVTLTQNESNSDSVIRATPRHNKLVWMSFAKLGLWEIK